MARMILIPVGLLILLVGAMAWSGVGAQPKAELAFISSGTRADINTLDPNQMSYVQDFRISYAIREGLYEYSAGTLEPRAAGAKSVEISPDNMVFTFHLRPEACWTNGDRVTARDYYFAWRRMLEQPGDYTYLFYYIKNAREYEAAFAEGKAFGFEKVGIEAVDDATFKVTLHDPCGFFLDLIAFVPFYPMHEKSMLPFKEVDAKTGRVSYRPEFTRPGNVVTNGAFELTRWDYKRRLWLQKSPTYWDRANVHLNSIEMVINEDRLSQSMFYESGVADWVTDTGSDISAELRAKGRKDLIVTPGFGTAFLTINTAEKIAGIMEKNPLHDQRVRQAISMAIDKQQICDNIMRNGEKPATTYVPPGIFPGFVNVPGYGYDIAKAKQLLAEAGYPNGVGFPTLPMVFTGASPVLTDEMQFIKSQLKANLNIEVQLQPLEQKITSQRVHGKEYVMAPSSWIGDYGDVSTFTDKYLSSSLNNDSNWAVAEFDGLCAEASHEGRVEPRLRLLEKAEKIINDDLPIIPLYYVVNTDTVRPYVTIQFNPRMTVNFKAIDVDELRKKGWSGARR